MATINEFQFDSGIQIFRFSDTSGSLILEFFVNPADVGLMARCEEVQKFFEKEKGFLTDAGSPEKLLAINGLIEEKINYMLGTNKNIFQHPITATTIMPDGRIFAELVMDKVIDVIKPEMEKRATRKTEHLAKYTAKYE